MSENNTGYELILNASEGALQIAVTFDEELLCFEEWHAKNGASEILADALAEIFRRLGIAAGNFRRIACVTGPGSFTGIRVILTTAAALRRTSHAQLASLSYLQALAATAVMYREALYPANIAVLTHARRNLAHFQKFRSYGPVIPPVAESDITLVEPERALMELAGSGAIVCGGAIERNPDIFALPVTGKGPEKAPDLIILPRLRHPSVQALCLLARHGDYFPNDLEPTYTRGCDAVENLEKTPGNEDKLELLDSILHEKPLGGE